MEIDVVQSLYNETKVLDDYLLENGEISLKNTVDSNLRKSILLSSASYFEKQIVDLIVRYTYKVTVGDEKLISFIQKKALSRQYHTLFTWDKNNCNSFYALFGEDFKLHFSNLIKEDQELDSSAKAFLEIGNERNRMVHQDFGQFTLEKTADEIIALHIKAKFFLYKLEENLFGKIEE